MIKGSIDSIETLGLVDGPGIRVVVFLNGCKLRCKYCHNPEIWKMKENNYTPEDLRDKLRKYKPYFHSYGGVTFSGGEPLLQKDFLIETIKLLKEDNIHVALDTSGVGFGNYEELLKLVDLVILDIKHVNNDEYKDLTGSDINESLNFIETCNRLNKKMWIRQVIIPDLNDNKEYLLSLKRFIKRINNIEKIEFLPYHRLGIEKYDVLKIAYPYKDKQDMSKEKCNELYNVFMEME